jgi:hypothetical protein
MKRIEITRYGTRNWAVWLDGELLAVTVYKKGARAIARVLAGLLPGLEPSALHSPHER